MDEAIGLQVRVLHQVFCIIFIKCELVCKVVKCIDVRHELFVKESFFFLICV